MEIIYTTRAMHFSSGYELSQRASSEQQSMGFAGRKSKMPQIFTFEPFRESAKPKRRKRRTLKILYPPRQVRRSLPTEKDVTKRLLLFFLSIVLFQVYTANEEELSLPTPDLSPAELVSTSTLSPSSPPVSAALSVVFLPASPGAENNCSQQQPEGGHLLQTARLVRSCKM